MACVGGNTISFASKFKKVISNELDEPRYHILQKNTREVAGCGGNVEFRNESILELVKSVQFDILFLDPEWCVYMLISLCFFVFLLVCRCIVNLAPLFIMLYFLRI